MNRPPHVRIIALGNEFAGDDGAAMQAIRGLCALPAEFVFAGRPGPGLVEMICTDTPTLLVDVIRSGRTPGSVISLPLTELKERVVDGSQVSSHGLGPAQAVRLADALGRDLSPGFFVGIEGVNFAPGIRLSDVVTRGLPHLVNELRRLHQGLIGRQAEPYEASVHERHEGREA